MFAAFCILAPGVSRHVFACPDPGQAVDLKHDLVATAHILRDELKALILRLSEETRKSDIDGLRDAIQSCQRAGLLDDDCGVDCVLTKARQSLAELEELLLGLNFAVQSRDVVRLEDLISKCETKGVPPRYFHRAARCQKEIVSLMNNLDSARKGLDLGSLDHAIQDSKGCGLSSQIVVANLFVSSLPFLRCMSDRFVSKRRSAESMGCRRPLSKRWNM